MRNGDVYVRKGASPILIGVDDYYVLGSTRPTASSDNHYCFSRIKSSREASEEMVHVKGYSFAFNLSEILGPIGGELTALVASGE